MPHQQSTLSQSPGSHICSTSPAWQRYRFTAILSMALAFFALTLSGCDIGDTLWDLINTESDAEAQVFPNENQRVRTFVIETNSFSIESEDESDPTPFTATVGDSVTEYTMTADGTLRFVESDGGTEITLDNMESGDRIIERPGATGTGTLTIIDASPIVPAN